MPGRATTRSLRQLSRENAGCIAIRMMPSPSTSIAGSGAVDGLRLPVHDDVRESFLREGVAIVLNSLDPQAASTLAEVALTATARDALEIRRSSDEGSLDYRVVTGDAIRSDARPIFSLYESAELLTWIRYVTGKGDVQRSPHLRSAVNINLLDTPGQEYRWHHDAVPFTAVLFLTTIPESAGGELLVRTISGRLLTIEPVAGQLVLMDGHRCAHAVTRLRAHAARISVPMVFPAVHADRPPGLDDYLYATSQQ